MSPKAKAIAMVFILVAGALSAYLLSAYFIGRESSLKEKKLAIISSFSTRGESVAADIDEDGIKNLVEIRYGLNPLNPDSDGDGISDGTERNWSIDVDGDGLINALDVDSDDDGLLDGIEDKNLNGILDENETDPLNLDTDGDNLYDGIEDCNRDGRRDENETSPIDEDTDGDGLPDGGEMFWNVDSDGDGLINALDPDSDNDGLSDGEELERGTDVLKKDTDGDTLSDGLEVSIGLNPLSMDSDNDLLPDNEESIYTWREMEDIVKEKSLVTNDGSASHGKAVTLDGDKASFDLSLGEDKYKLYWRMKCTSSTSSTPTITVSIQNSKGDQILTEVHPLPMMVDKNGVNKNIYRWYSTQFFATGKEEEIKVTFSSTSGETILIDKILVHKGMPDMKNSLTDPKCNDTDGDGVIDGLESPAPSLWLEAEDFALESGQIISGSTYSNGLAVKPIFVTNEIVYCVIEDINCSKGYHSLFIRSGIYLPPNIPNPQLDGHLDVEIENNGNKISGYCRVPWQYERGRWNVVYFNGNVSNSTFWIEKSKVTIKILLNTSVAGGFVFVDKIHLVHMRFYRNWMQLHYGDVDPLPRCLDPLDPDTDLDGYRQADGAIKGSTGYLTDGFESKRGFNPFDIDTDNDCMQTWNISLTDDIDPDPLSWDSDGDGLFDWIEDKNGNGRWDIEYGETNLFDADSDDDGLLDSNENPSYQGYSYYETDPINPDTDGDGLIDGIEVGLWRPQREDATKNWIKREDELKEMLQVTDPRDWDTDDDGLPDGWIDFNGNGIRDLGEFEDYNLNGVREQGGWNPGGGGGETSPLLKDTDNDGLTDKEEVLKGGNPVEVQPFDLELSEIILSPEEGLIHYWEEKANVRIGCLLFNNGPGRVVKYSSGFKIMVGFRINVTEAGRKIISRVVYRPVEMDANTSSVVYVVNLDLPAGRHEIDVSMAVYKLTGSGWVKADYELNRENNHLSKEVMVKSYPQAYAEYLNIEETKGGFKVEFYGYGIDRDSSKLTYKWDFDGDGVADYSIRVANNSNFVFQNRSVEWVYSTGGSKQVIFQVIDEDGLSDNRKLVFGLWHIGKGDFDGDGLSSDEEKIYHTDPENPDTDNDSLPDGYEIRIGSDPLDKDSDDDRLPDNLEVSLMVAFGYDPFDKPDTDNDGIINIRDRDSDDDGLYDGDEVVCCNPERAEWIDSWSGYNPYSNDTDGDNLNDGEEISRFNTDPLNPDTDGDGLEDDKEIFLSTNPRKRDTDDDGIVDSLDLQPFSGKIKPYVGSYPVFSNMIKPNLVKFNGTVMVYHIQGRAYRMDVANWYEISSSNVKSKSPTASNVLNYDWSPYRALSATKGETVDPPRGVVEGCIDSSPPYYKVRYDVKYTNFRTTFINSKEVRVKRSEWEEMWGALFYIPCYQKGNHSLAMQFSIEAGQDHYYFSKNHYTLPAFICKFYNDSSLEEKGSFLEIIAPFVRIDNHVYQVNIPLPELSDDIHLFLIPVWISRFDAIQSIRFMRGDIYSFGSLSRMVQIGNKQLLYGYANFEDISNRFSLDDWLVEEKYSEDKVSRSLIVKYINDVYTLDEETVNEYLYKNQQWTLYRMVKRDRERILEIKNLDDFVEEAKKVIEKRMERVEKTESAIEDFVDAVEASLDYSSSRESSPSDLGVDVVTSITLRETSTIVAAENKVVAKMLRLYNPMKAAYEEVAELRVEYGEFKEFLEKTRNARRAASGGREIEDISSIRFIKKVVMDRAKTLKSPLKSAGFYATAAVGAVEIGVYLYEATQTDDTFEKSYYIASATVAGVLLGVTIVLYFIPGGQLVAAVLTVILLIPAAEEKIEEFTRWLGEGWEELLGEVPRRFALEMFEMACKRTVELAEQSVGRGECAIFVLPDWK